MDLDFNVRQDILLLRNKLADLCDAPEYLPEALKGNRYWDSFNKMYHIMGRECVYLTKIATLMYIEDFPSAQQVLQIDIPIKNNG